MKGRPKKNLRQMGLITYSSKGLLLVVIFAASRHWPESLRGLRNLLCLRMPDWSQPMRINPIISHALGSRSFVTWNTKVIHPRFRVVPTFQKRGRKDQEGRRKNPWW